MKKRGASTREHLKMLAQLVKADGCSSALDFWFTEACNEHDVYYRTGKDCNDKPLTRAQADKLFLKSMQRDAISPVGKWILAPAYWAAVRVFGGRHFKGTNANGNAGENKRGKTPRTVHPPDAG